MLSGLTNNLFTYQEQFVKKENLIIKETHFDLYQYYSHSPTTWQFFNLGCALNFVRKLYNSVKEEMNNVIPVV